MVGSSEGLDVGEEVGEEVGCKQSNIWIYVRCINTDILNEYAYMMTNISTNSLNWSGLQKGSMLERRWGRKLAI